MKAENKEMRILSSSSIKSSFWFIVLISFRPRYCSDKAFTFREFILSIFSKKYFYDFDKLKYIFKIKNLMF